MPGPPEPVAPVTPRPSSPEPPSGVPDAAPSLARLEALLRPHGLVARGGFAIRPTDEVPALDGAVPARALVLVGQAGRSIWSAFSASPERRDGAPDPLDRWSARIGRGIARELGARALFPFGGPPFLPFLRWAARAEPLGASPLGLALHPEHGLWHAWRFALAFPDVPADLAPPPPRPPHACEGCRSKPCLGACPVGAFDAAGYDVGACRAHLATPAGADCLERGCRARDACPVGVASRYPEAQVRFHMRAFGGP